MQKSSRYLGIIAAALTSLSTAYSQNLPYSPNLTLKASQTGNGAGGSASANVPLDRGFFVEATGEALSEEQSGALGLGYRNVNRELKRTLGVNGFLNQTKEGAVGSLGAEIFKNDFLIHGNLYGGSFNGADIVALYRISLKDKSHKTLADIRPLVGAFYFKGKEEQEASGVRAGAEARIPINKRLEGLLGANVYSDNQVRGGYDVSVGLRGFFGKGVKPIENFEPTRRLYPIFKEVEEIVEPEPIKTTTTTERKEPEPKPTPDTHSGDTGQDITHSGD